MIFRAVSVCVMDDGPFAQPDNLDRIETDVDMVVLTYQEHIEMYSGISLFNFTFNEMLSVYVRCPLISICIKIFVFNCLHLLALLVDRSHDWIMVIWCVQCVCRDWC